MHPRMTRRIMARIIAKTFETDFEILCGPSRSPRHCKARYGIWHLVKDLVPTTSLLQLGELVGGKDHSTVLHGLARASDLLVTDDVFRNRIEAARKAIAEWAPGEAQRPEPLRSLVPVARKVETPPVTKLEAPEPKGKTSEMGLIEYDNWFRRSCISSEALFLDAMRAAYPERFQVLEAAE